MADYSNTTTNSKITTSTIDDFRGKFSELARPNLFQVKLYKPKEATAPLVPLTNTGGSGGDPSNKGSTLQEQSTFLIKASSFPASTIGVVEVPFRGRQLKIAGDRTYEPWSVTVLNDENFTIRKQLEVWAQAIQEYKFNGSSSQKTDDYMGNATVEQLSRGGDVIKKAQMSGIWPSNISALDLDWGTNDTPEEYTVEFQVQYWEPVITVDGAQ